MHVNTNSALILTTKYLLNASNYIGSFKKEI